MGKHKTEIQINVNHVGKNIKLESLLKTMWKNIRLTFLTLYLLFHQLQDYCKSCGKKRKIGKFIEKNEE